MQLRPDAPPNGAHQGSDRRHADHPRSEPLPDGDRARLGRHRVELSPHYRLIVTRETTLDELSVETEVTDEVFRTVGAEVLDDEAVAADELLASLRARIQRGIKETLGVIANVVLKAPGTVPRSEGGKLNRVEDRRKLV